MKARLVTAAQGARWVGEGWRLFKATPFTWVGVLIGSFALLLVLGRVPVLGATLFVLLTPALWAGFMAVARAAAGRSAESALDFARTLGREARALAALGVLYLVANLAAIAATIPFGDGLLADWVLRGRAPAREQMGSTAFMLDVALSMLFYSPAMLAYWFAPVLVTWHGAGPLKALFFSVAACLYNWRAFTAYGVAVLLVFVAAFALLSLASGLLVAASGAPPDASLVVILPAFAVFVSVLIASAYASYCDVFDTGAIAKSPTIPV
ncbi:MAG: hypothetical protein HYS35_07530 [Betaproteobacteria bacterium]|nr:hypothetical protein [Betaproteobacteria bacterium]